MINVYESVDLNKRKSAVVVVFFVLFIAIATYVLSIALGYLMGIEPGGLGMVGVALIISGLMSFGGYYWSDKIVLGISGAKPVGKNDYKLYHSVVQNLCLASQLPEPKLYVIEDTATNAFATGRDPQHAALCATTGILEKLTRTELEGVIGHELTHVKNFDIRLMSLVSVMVGSVALLADMFFRMSYFGNRSRDRDDRGQVGALLMILGIVFAVLSPLIAQLIQLAISRRREFFADAGSVALTRQPGGLISALQKIAGDHEALEAANKATAHLYIVNPFKDKAKGAIGLFAGLFNTHPPIAERIKALQAMT